MALSWQREHRLPGQDARARSGAAFPVVRREHPKHQQRRAANAFRTFAEYWSARARSTAFAVLGFALGRQRPVARARGGPDETLPNSAEHSGRALRRRG